MKTIIKIFVIITVGFTAINTSAQSKKDTTLVVNGICEMCKMTIENAAYIKGVSHAEWNPETKVLMLTYESGTVTPEQINRSINESGYDTEFSTANEEAYQKLHKCCHYRDPAVVKEHQNK